MINLGRTYYAENTIETETPSGEKMKPIYRERENEKGEKWLDVVDEIDLEEFINASADAHRISNMVKTYNPENFGLRITQNPEINDLRGAPSSLYEVYEQAQNAKNTFEKLSTEIKEKYNMTVKEYLTTEKKEETNNDTEPNE